MTKETRYDRLKRFEEFQETVKPIFEQFKIEDEKYKKFDDTNSLCICPKGRAGNIDKRLTEIFYGARPFDIEEKIGANFQRETKTLTEYGTTLSFCLNDHGFVAIILYPSRTDNTKSIESAIFIKNYLHPKKLKSKYFLRRQWEFLNTYMERTSIDGNPTLKDKIICSYLRYCKNKVVDNKFQPKKVITHLTSSLRFMVTVGLSGFLIYIFTIIPNKNDKVILTKENEQLKEIISKLNNIIYLQKNQIEMETNRKYIHEKKDNLSEKKRKENLKNTTANTRSRKTTEP